MPERPYPDLKFAVSEGMVLAGRFSVIYGLVISAFEKFWLQKDYLATALNTHDYSKIPQPTDLVAVAGGILGFLLARKGHEVYRSALAASQMQQPQSLF